MKELIHYSRYGYNGDMTYTSVCGEIVKSHQNNIDTTVHPEKANCIECMRTNSYQVDLYDFHQTEKGMKRRIYIESDILKASELRSASRDVHYWAEGLGEKVVERGFSEVLDFAWHDLEKTWEAVKKADEVWANSSLMPLSGGSYIGAPLIFNGMCERAVKEGITGKSVYILNTVENIYWDMIDVKLMKKAFKKNSLFMYDDHYNLHKINVAKLKIS